MRWPSTAFARFAYSPTNHTRTWRGWQGPAAFAFAAQLGGVIGPHYAASKAGAIGLTHSLAALLAKEGITANVIAPALVETEMITRNSKARPDIVPVGRFGNVEEVADVVVTLAGNGYITGQTISITGGWYMS